MSLSLGPRASYRVLECLGLSFACGRVEVDGDVMVVRLVRFAFKAPVGACHCMAASCRPRMTWIFASPHALVALPEPCVWAHTLVGGGDLSCEAETCRARWRLVGDAAVRPRTGCLASESLDEDLLAFPETQRQVESALLLDVVISKGTTILKLLAS
jgi:hypothetical protein